MEAVSAHRVAAGRLVIAELDGVRVVCLKAERQGRDFLTHYLIPLDPLPADPGRLRLHYVDPETPLLPAAVRLTVGAEVRRPAEVGEVVINALGRFLKVYDAAKTERHFAYVEVASGEVRLRQEKGGVPATAAWHLER